MFEAAQAEAIRPENEAVGVRPRHIGGGMNFNKAIDTVNALVVFCGSDTDLEAWQKCLMVLEAAAKVSERDLGRVFMGFVSAELRELLEAIKSANAALPDAPKGGTDEAE